jgi:hypothetical protein
MTADCLALLQPVCVSLFLQDDHLPLNTQHVIACVLQQYVWLSWLGDCPVLRALLQTSSSTGANCSLFA